MVTLAVPPAALDPVLFSDYEQLKRFFYLFMFRGPLGLAEAVAVRDGMSFIDKLGRKTLLLIGAVAWAVRSFGGSPIRMV